MISTEPLDLCGLLPCHRERAASRRRRRLRAVLYVAAVLGGLVVWGLTGAAGAQDVDPCSELRAATQDFGTEPTRNELGGIAGIWFPVPIARLMLCEVRELRVRRREIALDVRELRLWEQRVALTERQRDLAVEARDTLEGVVEAAERRAREAESETEAWYRSPVLWVVVGIVVGAGVVIGGAYVASVAIP